MTTIKQFAAAAAVATLSFAASDLSASAQSSLSNDPAAAPAHQVYRRQPVRTVRSREAVAERRPLTVRRTVVEAPVVVAPAPVVAAGPGTLVTGPLGFASNVISLPFQALNGIFPATGDVASNPLVLIGAPLHAVGDIAQVPLRVISAPFGGATIATY